MYGASRTWINPNVRENAATIALNNAQEKTCPRSPFFTRNFDIKGHRADWAEGIKRRQTAKIEQAEHEAEQLQQSKEGVSFHEDKSDTPKKDKSTKIVYAPAQRPAFDGKTFNTNHSYVLSWATVFCPSYKEGKANIGPWPSREEAEHEGEQRVSTDLLHGRFLGVPRVDDGSGTTAWQIRGCIAQYPLEDFYYPLPSAVEIFMRTHYIPELEFDDEAGKEALGDELLGMLDPADQW